MTFFFVFFFLVSDTCESEKKSEFFQQESNLYITYYSYTHYISLVDSWEKDK